VVQSGTEAAEPKLAVRDPYIFKMVRKHMGVRSSFLTKAKKKNLKD